MILTKNVIRLTFEVGSISSTIKDKCKVFWLGKNEVYIIIKKY